MPRAPLIALAGAALVLGVHLELTVRRTDRARVTFDSAEYAVAGREWMRSGRLGTTFVLPKEPRRPARPPFPLILGHPLVPALDALAFRLAGPRGEATLLPPALAFLALVGVSLALARALGASPAGALVGAGAVSVAPGVLHYAAEGLTELPFAALLAAVLFLLARERRAPPVAFGALLGLAHLTRPIMAPLVPVALAALALREPPGGRLRSLVLAAVSFLPFAGALALYKALAAGDPFAEIARYNLLVGLTPALTPVGVQCMVDPPAPLPFMLTHLDAVGRKLGAALPDLSLGVFAQAGPLGAVAAAGLGAGLARRRERAPAVALLGFAAALIVISAFTLPSRRYLAPLLPVMLVVAVVTLERAARGARWPAALAVGIPALAVALTLGYATAAAWKRAVRDGVRDRGAFTESEWRSTGGQIRALLPPGTLLASDAGAFVAWYADRPAVQIPQRPADLASLEERLDIGALALTNEWLVDEPGFEGWRELAARPGGAPGWRHLATTRSGRLRVVLLARERPTR